MVANAIHFPTIQIPHRERTQLSKAYTAWRKWTMSRGQFRVLLIVCAVASLLGGALSGSLMGVRAQDHPWTKRTTSESFGRGRARGQAGRTRCDFPRQCGTRAV